MRTRRAMERSRRGAVALAAAAVAALSATVHAEKPDDEAGKLPVEGFLPARRLEITAGLQQSFALQDGQLRFRAGPTFDVVPWIPRESQPLRVSLYGAALFGTWSDGAAFRPLGEGGLRIRVSLFPNEAVDIYGLLGGGVIGGGDGNARLGLRINPGLGLRLFQALSTEIGADGLFAPGRPFLSAGKPYDAAIGLSTMVSFDFCSLGTLCNHPPILQERDDRTCCVFKEAQSICGHARQAGAGAGLCEAARAALNPRVHKVYPREDPFRRFLEATLEELRASAPAAATPGLIAELERLRDAHDRLASWRQRGREQELALAKERRVVRRKRVYSPYATDLLRALGCGWEEAEQPPAGGQACQDVCDAPYPGADACAAAR